jgi:hypothetical protein
VQKREQSGRVLRGLTTMQAAADARRAKTAKPMFYRTRWKRLRSRVSSLRGGSGCIVGGSGGVPP